VQTFAPKKILIWTVAVALAASLIAAPYCHATAAFAAQQAQRHGEQTAQVDAFPVEYRAIAVSGGLQTGFPDHAKMHYRGPPRKSLSESGEDEQDEEVVRAVFVGRALVRGCKAYLDVMQPGWRQYSPEPQQPLINSVVLVTGCHEHANQYWVYLVDSRQFLSILNNEPRFLAITPDTGLIDMDSNETDDAVRQFALRELDRRENTIAGGAQMDRTRVAIPMVVAVHYHESFVPSPSIRAHADGTLITNFPESLALWANVSDADRMGDISTASDRRNHECQVSDATCGSSTSLREQRQQRYWDGIRAAIRRAEAYPIPRTEWHAPCKCRMETRLGTSARQLRINYPLTAAELMQAFRASGYQFDPVHGELVPSR
jgi:hypothetical protein